MGASKSPPGSKSARVGVRELRQNLSVYLDRVKQGERLEVTERGRPVALLVPLPKQGDLVERMIAEGRLIPARMPFPEYLKGLKPLAALPDGRTLTQILLEQREEERS